MTDQPRSLSRRSLLKIFAATPVAALAVDKLLDREVEEQAAELVLQDAGKLIPLDEFAPEIDLDEVVEVDTEIKEKHEALWAATKREPYSSLKEFERYAKPLTGAHHTRFCKYLGENHAHYFNPVGELGVPFSGKLSSPTHYLTHQESLDALASRQEQLEATAIYEGGVGVIPPSYMGTDLLTEMLESLRVAEIGVHHDAQSFWELAASGELCGRYADSAHYYEVRSPYAELRFSGYPMVIDTQFPDGYYWWRLSQHRHPLT